ncbi:MAG: DEAD/DEAH box helicase family protein [Hydrogenothermaceae bacterium]|nr:DEAD/DEAH box helicase family protein [Hydrogenothermaceae bacterium]
MNLEKYLVLNKYLLSLFGVGEFKELQQKLRDAQTGYDSEGKSHFARVLRSSLSNLKIPEDKLWEYDKNIQSYIEKISYNREISLKYFQYLAVLFAEIVLDNLKNRKSYFIEELNSFLEKYKREQLISIIDKFKEDDLEKLAFWMATGSGKTLIAHKLPSIFQIQLVLSR